MNAADHLRFARHKRLDEIRRLNKHPKLLTLIGEWSSCLPRIANASEADTKNFGFEQVNSYSEASAGWVFWNFKVGESYNLPKNYEPKRCWNGYKDYEFLLGF